MKNKKTFFLFKMFLLGCLVPQFCFGGLCQKFLTKKNTLDPEVERFYGQLLHEEIDHLQYLLGTQSEITLAPRSQKLHITIAKSQKFPGFTLSQNYLPRDPTKPSQIQFKNFHFFVPNVLPDDKDIPIVHLRLLEAVVKALTEVSTLIVTANGRHPVQHMQKMAKVYRFHSHVLHRLVHEVVKDHPEIKLQKKDRIRVSILRSFVSSLFPRYKPMREMAYNRETLATFTPEDSVLERFHRQNRVVKIVKSKVFGQWFNSNFYASVLLLGAVSVTQMDISLRTTKTLAEVMLETAQIMESQAFLPPNESTNSNFMYDGAKFYFEKEFSQLLQIQQQLVDNPLSNSNETKKAAEDFHFLFNKLLEDRRYYLRKNRLTTEYFADIGFDQFIAENSVPQE